MNASIETREASPAAAAPRRQATFPMLLRREYWEHKGGFLWAPAIAGGISLLLTAIFAAIGTVAARKAAAEGKLEVDGVTINGLDLDLLTSSMRPEDLQQLGAGLDVSVLMASSWPFIVMAFVVFFYCLGALYDERKDRSVLFWKSLPVSDRDTVLSKLASAALVAPVLATAAALATMLLFMLMLSLLVAVHGGNPLQLLWGTASPFRIALLFVAAIPVYAAWALPTFGWLLLCSAWARSKPFLWAIVIPVLFGLFVWWFDAMSLFGRDAGWFWQNVVVRMLFSVVPGGWLDAIDLQAVAAGHSGFDDPEGMRRMLNLKVLYSAFLSPKMWIGAAAGAAMVAIAIPLRRWRDDG